LYLFCMVCSPLLLAAQQPRITISGRVSGQGDRPLAGAQVFIQELRLGTATTPAGTYSFSVAADADRGRQLTLVARYLGHKPARRVINLSGSQTVNFALESDPARLEEVVTTGVAASTEIKKVPFAIGIVSADVLKEVPATTALGGLNGKVPGVRVSTTGGAPGDAPSIKLRSATSLTGTQEPLIIIDGTITRATLADVNAQDIDRVEVIKGAAASSLYGSDAANGVVQIFTKRGADLAEGRQNVIFRSEYGNSFLGRTIPQAMAHSWQVDAAGNYRRTPGGARIPEPSGIADHPYLNPVDHQKEALQNGLFATNYLSIGQRQGTTNYNASFEHSRQRGILFGVKGFTRQNARVNLDKTLNDRLDVSLGTFFARSNNDKPDEGPGSPFFGLTFVEPDVDLQALNPDGSPYRAKIPDRVSNASNPLYALTNIQKGTLRSRFSGTAHVRYRLLDWVTAEGNYNYDQETQNYKRLTPKGFLSATGIQGLGRLDQEDIGGTTINTGATLTAQRSFGWLTNTTKASMVYEGQTRHQFSLTAGALTIGQVPEFTAADNSTLIPGSESITIRSRNFFLISTFDIKDRYILDGLVRRDESSLFGPDNRTATYFRASGAYRLSEDFHIPNVDELRLRASYGTAGLRPRFEAQYEAFEVFGGNPRRRTLGNSDLAPAKSAETELGVNLDFLQRFKAEYTYSRKITKDQILLVPLSAAVGFREQWKNAGELTGHTHEAALSAIVMDRPEFSWHATVTGDRTRQRITGLTVAPFLTGPRYNGNDEVTQIFRIASGEPFGVMYGNKTVRTLNQLYDDPAKKALSGAGQAWAPDSVLVNEEGYVVRKSTWRTVDEKPIRYVNSKGEEIMQIGDVNPDFNLTFSNVVNWRGFMVSSQVDWVHGGNIYNGTRQWPFFENRDAIYDQTAKPAAERKPQQYYNYFYNSINPIDFFVEDGSYVKLKELAVNYTFGADQAGRLSKGRFSSMRFGVIGRNLFTKTKYSGYDPEVAGLSGDPYSYRFDGFSYPNFRTFTGFVELGF
jgi:TonB-linked SusC/RagA family outer membrane protein